MAFAGIMFRSRNCFSRGRMRRCTTSSATINRGSATRKRTWVSMSNRNGTPVLPRHRFPSSPESSSSGSQANSAMTMMRWRTIISASSVRCAFRKSWKSGPPRTSEKSGGLRRRSQLSEGSALRVFISGLLVNLTTARRKHMLIYCSWMLLLHSLRTLPPAPVREIPAGRSVATGGVRLLDKGKGRQGRCSSKDRLLPGRQL